MSNEKIERYYIWITPSYNSEAKVILSLYVRVNYDLARERIERIRMSLFLRHTDEYLDSIKLKVGMNQEIKNTIYDVSFIELIYDTWSNIYKTDYEEFIEKWNEGLEILQRESE